jgi:hypothetical protein
MNDEGRMTKEARNQVIEVAVVSGRFWSAPAKRSGDGALRRGQKDENRRVAGDSFHSLSAISSFILHPSSFIQSGLALRLPPRSKELCGCRRFRHSSFVIRHSLA